MAAKSHSCDALFGPFRINLETGEVLKSGVRIRLQHQPFRVLSVLLERPGGLVTRDELRERLWTDDTFVDFEHGVTTAVKKLRQTLNDSAGQPKYVETLPKRGYRFIAKVEFEEHPGSTPVAEETEPVEPVPESGGIPEAVPGRKEDETPEVAPRPPIFGAYSSRSVALAAIALGVLAFLVFGSFGRTGQSDRKIRRLAFAPDSIRLYNPGATISPDGRYIAYVGDAPDFQLWIQALADEEAMPVEGSKNVSLPFWSPDSRQVGFVSNGVMMRVSPQGGASIEVCDMPAGNFDGASWSTDGGRIVFSAGRPPRMFSAPAAGGAAEPLFDPVALEDGSDGNRDPAFVRTNRRRNLLAFSVGRPEDERIAVRDLDTDEQQILEVGSRPAYASSGHLLYDRGGDIWAAPFSGANLSFDGEAKLVARRGRRASVSDDGTLVYVDDLRTNRERRLAWRNRKGDVVGPTGPPVESISHFAAARSGNSAAIVSFVGDRTEAVLLDLAGDDQQILRMESKYVSHPVWGPRGETLSWREGRGSGTVLRIGAAVDDQSASGGVVLDLPGLNEVSDWSSDGKLLFFTQDDDLWIARRQADGAWGVEPLLQGPGEQISARVSPDGRRFAYCSDASGQFEVYVGDLSAPYAARRISSEGGVQPAWSADGRELFYLSRGRLMAVPISPQGEADANATKVLFSDILLFPRDVSRYVYATTGPDRFLTIRHPDGERSRSIRVVDNWAEAY